MCVCVFKETLIPQTIHAFAGIQFMWVKFFSKEHKALLQ